MCVPADVTYAHLVPTLRTNNGPLVTSHKNQSDSASNSIASPVTPRLIKDS